MATFTVTGPTSIRAQIRRSGQKSMAKTFNKKTLAEAKKESEKWARAIESDMDAGKSMGVHGRTGVTLAQAISRYMEETPNISNPVKSVFNQWSASIGHVLLQDLTVQHIVKHIKNKAFASSTGQLHFTYLRMVLKMAQVGWEYHVPDILDRAQDSLKIHKLISPSKERDRRPTEEEIKKLIEFKYPGKIPMADIILFAISTAMRQAEITRIKHGTVDVKNKTVLIKDRKHPTKKIGNNKTVPLLDEALQIIQRQPKVEGNDNIFPFNSQVLCNYFIKACKTLGIEDLHFHDLRHEGTSRLFEMGYQIHEVSMFTGHEDWKNLKRYTQLKAKNVRRIKLQPPEELPSNVLSAADMKEFNEFRKFKAMQKLMEQAETV